MKYGIAPGCLLLIGSVAVAGDHQVMVENFTFTPSELTIMVGDSVTWTNVEGFHNVSADDGSFRCANGCDGDGGNGDAASAPWSFTLTFDTPEMIAYFCEIHGGAGGAGMSGTVTVLDDVIFSDGFESGSN